MARSCDRCGLPALMLSPAIWWITAAQASWPASIISPHRYRPAWLASSQTRRSSFAIEFARKALDEVPYLSLFFRTNFSEGTGCLPFFPRAPADADLVQLAALADDASPWLARSSRAQQSHAWFV